jgi:hypothetical protein
MRGASLVSRFFKGAQMATGDPTNAYNPRANWSDDDLSRTLNLTSRRISDVQHELNGLFSDRDAMNAEIERRKEHTS